jgi:hypothetical protein
MKIDKITFKEGKAWLAVFSDENEYLGTWHVVNPQFVQALQNEHPKNLRVW